MTILALDYLDDRTAVADAQHAIGVIALSGGAGADLSIGLASLPVTPGAEPAGGLREVWRTGRAVERRDTFEGIRFARAGGLLFGALRRRIVAGEAAEAARSAYQAMFALIEREGCPHLWRVSNYLPDITRVEYGQERYRAFNAGRREAFVARDRDAEHAPAACGLGCGGDMLLMAFLAGDEPGGHVENPRQVSAFRYPEQYGASRPLFARATVAAGLLFISGTASIVGHESRHVGDVAAQTDETVRNIDAVLAEAPRAGGAFVRGDLRLKVYLRHADDLAVVRERLRAAGLPPPVGFLRAEICRPELDVEIEAHAPWKAG